MKNISPLESVFVATTTFVSLISGLALAPNCSLAATVGSEEVYAEIIVNPSRTFTPFTDEFDITFEVDLADGNTNPIGWASPSYIYPNLKPGFAYTMEVDGTYNDEFDVEFDVDRDNFRLYIDGVESYRVEKSPAYPPLFSYDYEIMLECKSCADSGSIPAGYSTKMTTSGKFIWEVSMGRLSSGQSAGTIAIREEEITSSIFSASALIYNSNSSEVEILKEGSTLRQVKAHQTLADIIPITDGYEIKFYPREDIGSKTGSGCGGSGCFDVSSADPFVAFKFERETSGNDNKLKITRTRYDSDPDETWVTNIDDTSGVWATTTEDNLRKIDSTNSETGGVRTETTEVKHGVTPYPLATRTDRLYKTFAGEERVWKVIEDPDAPAYGGAEYTTEFDYYTDSQEEATYGKEKWVKYPDGNWEHYTYYTSGDSAGMLHKIFTPFKDAPTLPTSADATNQNKTRATIYTYADDCDGASVLRNTVEVTVGDGTSSNTRVSYTELLHDYDGTFNSEPIHIVTRKDHYKSGTNYYTTVRASYRADAGGGLAGRTIFVKSPDRSMRYTTYEEGEVTYNGTSKQWEFGGSSGNPIGWRISTHYGTSSSTGVTIATIDGTVFKMIDEKSHKEVVIIDDRGHSVRTEMHIYDTGFVLAGYTDSVYNDAGNLTESVDDRGRKYSATWVNGLKTSETNVDGTITDFTNDALGRLIQTDRASATVDSLSIPSVRSYYLFDASSRLLKREIGTSSKITTEWDYDYAGRLEEKEEFSTAASAYQFTTSYTYANGGRTVTVTKPGSGDEGGGTAVTANFYDGRVKSLTGTGVIEKHYDYGVDGSAYEWAMVRVGDSSSTRKTTTTYNWVGNMIKEEMPTDDGGADFKREYFYSPDNYPSISGEGFLSRVTETDLADQYFEYDTMGRHIKEGLDFDDGSSNDYTDLVADSDDRISERDVSYSYNATSQDWWLKVEDSVYGINADGTHSSSSTPVLISKNLARLTGFATNVVAESYIFDAHNSESSKIVRTTEIDRASKKRLEKVNYPDSSTVETTTFGNGLPIKHISAQNVTTKSYYDAWGRIDKVNDRTGDHVSTYESETTLLTKINTPSNSDPEFDYDSAGRRNEVKRPKAASNYVTAYTEYDKLGRVVKRWGSAVNPVEFQYDEQTIKYGDLWKQKTYRGGDFSTATWPGSPGTADVTEYDYDVATGLLAKTTTADSKEVRYTYTDRGQVRTKRWAREVIAGGSEDHPYIYYAYHSATGELTNKYYKKTSGADPASNPLGDSDEGTSNITFTYTRLGSLKSVTDYVGTRNFTYRTSDFQLDQEKLGTGHGTNKMITREYYNSTSGGYYQGKYRGVKYGLTTDDDKYVQARYTFESTTGRINEIDYYRSGSNNLQFDYSYLANSNLVSGIDLETDEEDAYEVNRTWESDRNLLQSSEYEWNSSDKALNYYKYDWLGRRTEEFQRGEVYDIYQEEPTSSGVDGIMVQYGYSDRSELTSAISHLDTNSSGSFVVGSADDTEVYGRSFQYSYDNQGNRASTDGTTVNGRAADYVIYENNLNQYSWREIPGYIDIAVKAADTATVTVTDETPNPDVDYSTSQQGEYFYAELDDDGATGGYDNSSGGLLRTISISDGTTLVEGNEFLKEDVEDYYYWDDGMIQWDGNWYHAYDAENRPTWIAMGDVAGAEPSPRVGLTFRYDYLGRRVLKMVYHWNGSSWVWQSNRKYVYDGFNLIAETDWNGNIKRTYVWGLDESGSLSGAGGVGGLLMIRDEATTKEYFVMNDGKGNVNGILNAETGSLVAAYEYGPFGEPLRANGTFSDDNNFRFSTKFTDPESGLVYFGLRHYNPSMGRFISRDPIGESGGLNLYGFVGNDPVNRWDYLGMLPYVELEEFEITDQRQLINAFFPSEWTSWSINVNFVGGETLGVVELPEFVVTGRTQGTQGTQKENPDCVKLRGYLADAQNAGAAYDGADPAPGFVDADLKSLGIDPYHMSADNYGFSTRLLVNSSGEYILSFRGTETTSGLDWATNFLQGALGLGGQYSLATGTTRLVRDAVGAENLRLVGHSLGGGLAASGTYHTGIAATTFNAAGVNSMTIRSTYSNAQNESMITSVFVRGDPLSLFNSLPLVPNADGNRVSVGPKQSITQGHQIGTVISNIKAEMKEKGCK